MSSLSENCGFSNATVCQAVASRRSNVASSFLGYKLIIGRPASWRKIEILTTSRLSNTTVRISVRPIIGRLLYMCSVYACTYHILTIGGVRSYVRSFVRS